MDTSVYKQLDLINRHFRKALTILQRLQRTPELKLLGAETHSLQLEELRASISEQVMAALGEIELRNAARSWRKRRAVEASWKDSGGGKKAPETTKRSKAK